MWDILNFCGEKSCSLYRSLRPLFDIITRIIWLHIFLYAWYQIRASPISFVLSCIQCRYHFHVFSCSSKFLFHHLRLCILRWVEPSWNANDEMVCEGHKVMFCRLFRRQWAAVAQQGRGESWKLIDIKLLIVLAQAVRLKQMRFFIGLRVQICHCRCRKTQTRLILFLWHGEDFCHSDYHQKFKKYRIQLL